MRWQERQREKPGKLGILSDLYDRVIVAVLDHMNIEIFLETQNRLSEVTKNDGKLKGMWDMTSARLHISLLHCYLSSHCIRLWPIV